ncbi:atp-dependent carboligase : Uncharacterized protein OS=Candidatus Methylomirabilis oxyfera GN=DAMO_0096 PE=4 SV=1: ATP-grasp_3 [Gemmataceae bacterium]|nr:atp-dependent carboligase : Uncharacterized protein OS=Candidatus Methylomirabilis oxyfera GN=DAMO_0096 PE=4 SV=1: ATP-grasp_3 [Gemmataceae bacterium]VTU02627.1 atp-dependent carboligase : Uncharacterized protein OS=Candidatus Methylomirabilis oxyfera GN=DAMO_0096 PE=4 SV=1: ATP-grasp_3 [Gemmataceae bacterium]
MGAKQPDATVGVVGASARAAVHSLLRAGYTAWAVDLFGDRDLAMVAPCAVCPLGEYPAALPGLSKQYPPGPVMYTGGLENHPQVVAELAASRELWGTGPTVLERVRDPYQLFPALAGAGFRVPMLVRRGQPCPATGRWLRKPLRSGGGLGIRFASPGEPPSADHVFQEFVDGVPMSVVYGGTTLLGVSEQLLGEPWLHAKPFVYCGSIGPVEPPTELVNRPASTVLDFGVRGLWNLDCVLSQGCVVPVEINPRYSASVEVVEHATGRAAFMVWQDQGRRAVPAVGKAIYYAPRDLSFPASGPWDADLAMPFNPWRLPTFADVTAAGAVVPAGQPVITIFASGSSAAECRGRLQSRARELDLLFAEHAT